MGTKYVDLSQSTRKEAAGKIVEGQEFTLVDIHRSAEYISHMIKNAASTATQHFLETGKSKFSGLDINKAKIRVAMLNSASSLDDISPLKSVGLHKLSGDRKNQWAMTINGPWRLCFRFEGGHAWDVEIINYH